MGQITANALAWVHFRTTGGWKRSVIVTGVYIVAVISLTMLGAYDSPMQVTRTLSTGAGIMLGVQALVLFPYVGYVILNTLQLDRKSGMMESHRLMPVDAHLVVLGYIAGGASTGLVFASVNFIMGGIMTAFAGMPITWWVAANLVLLVFCAFTWCAAALGGTLGNLLGLAMLAPFGIIMMSGGQVGEGMPGLLLIASPMLGRTLWDATSFNGDRLSAYCLAFVVQAAMATVFVRAAARRYRDSDATAFTGLLGFLLTALVSFCLTAGMPMSAQLTRRGGNAGRTDTGNYVISAIFVILIFCIITIYSRVAGQAGLRAKPKAGNIIATDTLLIIALLGCAIAPCVVRTPTPAQLGLSALICGLFLVAMLLWARVCCSMQKFGLAALCVVAAATTIAPLIVGTMLRYPDGGNSLASELIMQVSPLAALTAVWSGNDFKLQGVAVVIQAFLLLVPAGLLLTGYRREQNPPLLRAMA